MAGASRRPETRRHAERQHRADVEESVKDDLSRRHCALRPTSTAPSGKGGERQHMHRLLQKHCLQAKHDTCLLDHHTSGDSQIVLDFARQAVLH